MELIKRMGWWALAYIAVKWTLLGGLVWWLSRYDWFRLHYLLVLPVVVLLVLALRRRRAGRTQSFR